MLSWCHPCHRCPASSGSRNALSRRLGPVALGRGSFDAIGRGAHQTPTGGCVYLGRSPVNGQVGVALPSGAETMKVRVLGRVGQLPSTTTDFEPRGHRHGTHAMVPPRC